MFIFILVLSKKYENGYRRKSVNEIGLGGVGGTM
jgi:hypothetical protein